MKILKRISIFLITATLLFSNMFSFSVFADVTTDDGTGGGHNTAGNPCHWYFGKPSKKSDGNYRIDVMVNHRNTNHSSSSDTNEREYYNINKNITCNNSIPEKNSEKPNFDYIEASFIKINRNTGEKLGQEKIELPFSKKTFEDIASYYKRDSEYVKKAIIRHLQSNYYIDNWNGYNRMLRNLDSKYYLYSINIDLIIPKDPITEKIPKTRNNYKSSSDSKYCIEYMTQTIRGNKFSNSVANINDKSSVNSTKTVYSKCKTNKEFYENSKNLSLNENINYGIVGNSTNLSTYLKITRTTTNSWVEHYTHYKKYVWNDKKSKFVLEKEWDGKVESTSNESTSYSYKRETGKLFVKKEGNKISYSIKSPNYELLQWKDLTSEEYVKVKHTIDNIFTNIVDSSKKNVAVGNKKLSYTLDTGKNPGDTFKVVSDNNAKNLDITYNANTFFGVPIDYINKLATDTGSTLISSSMNMYCGSDLKEDSNVKLTSLQIVGSQKADKEELFGFKPYSLGGNEADTDYTHTYKFRAIKYGDYTLGDRKNTPYWYVTIKYSTPNKVGYSYKSTAPGTVSSKNEALNRMTCSGSKSNTEVNVKTTFYQPILEGGYIVRDVAGKNS